MIEMNCRLAAKHGLDAEIFDPYEQRVIPLREFSAKLLEIAHPGINATGNSSWISWIEKQIYGRTGALNIKQKINS